MADEAADRAEFVRAMMARHTEPMEPMEREELEAFYNFQHGGFKALRASIARRKRRPPASGTPGGNE